MIKKLNNLILDMDGVLWREETPLTDLPIYFGTLNDLDIRFVLATNNSTKIATQYVEKLAMFGVTIRPEQVVTSAEATAGYLREAYAPNTAVYVIGEQGLQQSLQNQGFQVLSYQ